MPLAICGCDKKYINTIPTRSISDTKNNNKEYSSYFHRGKNPIAVTHRMKAVGCSSAQPLNTHTVFINCSFRKSFSPRPSLFQCSFFLCVRVSKVGNFRNSDLRSAYCCLMSSDVRKKQPIRSFTQAGAQGDGQFQVRGTICELFLSCYT